MTLIFSNAHEVSRWQEYNCRHCTKAPEEWNADRQIESGQAGCGDLFDAIWEGEFSDEILERIGWTKWHSPGDEVWRCKEFEEKK